MAPLPTWKEVSRANRPEELEVLVGTNRYDCTIRDLFYFVAETKGSSDILQLRMSEDLKTRCAREHFRALSDDVRYEVVKDFTQVINLVMPYQCS